MKKIEPHLHTLDCDHCLRLAEDYRRFKPIIELRTVDREIVRTPKWIGGFIFTMILWTTIVGFLVYHQQQPIFPDPDLPNSEKAFITSSGTVTADNYDSEWKQKCQSAWKILQHPQTSKERLAYMILDQ